MGHDILELFQRLIFECRCDERLKAIAEDQYAWQTQYLRTQAFFFLPSFPGRLVGAWSANKSKLRVEIVIVNDCKSRAIKTTQCPEGAALFVRITDIMLHTFPSSQLTKS